MIPQPRPPRTAPSTLKSPLPPPAIPWDTPANVIIARPPLPPHTPPPRRHRRMLTSPGYPPPPTSHHDWTSAGKDIFACPPAKSSNASDSWTNKLLKDGAAKPSEDVSHAYAMLTYQHGVGSHKLGHQANRRHRNRGGRGDSSHWRWINYLYHSNETRIISRPAPWHSSNDEHDTTGGTSIGTAKALSRLKIAEESPSWWDNRAVEEWSTVLDTPRSFCLVQQQTPECRKYEFSWTKWAGSKTPPFIGLTNSRELLIIHANHPVNWSPKCY